MKDYHGMDPKELVLLYRKTGEEEILSALIYDFRAIIAQCTSAYFLAGAEKQDLVQEGRVGLFKAIRDYDPEKNDAFIPFAKLCIKRTIQTAVSTANRKKHIPLNESLSLEKEELDGGDISYKKASDPETLYIEAFEANDTLERIEKALSKGEKEVFFYLLEGLDYRQIADVLGRDVKSIDNAMQRIRNKANNIIKNRK